RPFGVPAAALKYAPCQLSWLQAVNDSPGITFRTNRDCHVFTPRRRCSLRAEMVASGPTPAASRRLDHRQLGADRRPSRPLPGMGSSDPFEPLKLTHIIEAGGRRSPVCDNKTARSEQNKEAAMVVMHRSVDITAAVFAAYLNARRWLISQRTARIRQMPS